MNIVTAAALLEKSKLEEFEDAIVKTAQAEIQNHAGELTESLNSLLDQKDSTPRLDRLVQQTKLAARMGRDMAKEAGIAGTIMGAVKPLAGKALGYAAMHPQRAMAAGGAALGALGGAATAQPGHRMSGALGGAALGGAAGYGLSRIPSGPTLQKGVADYAARGYQALGSPKLAFAPMGKAMGAGALLGAVGGALHKSPGEAQGLAAGHHLRNALVGAAGGAALGAGATKMPTMMGKAEGAIAHAPRGPMQSFHNPHAMPAAAPYSATEMQQMSRVKAMANSPEAEAARKARAMDAMRQNMQANPTMYGRSAAKPTTPPGATMAARRPAASVDPTGATLAKMAQRGGREFLKLAFSMSAQAEPGDPTGAQEPEAEAQFQAEPQRPPSKPAADLFQALRHLTPKMMRNLQIAQPGS